MKGGIYKRGNVYWYYLGSERKSTGCTSEREARRFLAEVAKAKTVEKKPIGSKIKISDAFSVFSRLVHTDRKTTESQMKRYKVAWGLFEKFAAENGVEYMTDVTETTVREFISSMINLPSSTLEKRTYYTRRVFALVCPEVKNPFDKIHPKTIAKGERVKFARLHPMQIEALLESAKSFGEDWYTVFLVGARTGLRYTDCVHLNEKDVDFNKRMIVLTPRKTAHHGVKVRIPMSEDLYEHLKTISEKGFLKDLEERVEGKNPVDSEGYFAPSIARSYLSNKHVNENTIKAIFSIAGCPVELVEKDGKTYRRSFHSLRVSMASMLAESGTPLQVAVSIMGHSAEEAMEYYRSDDTISTNFMNKAFSRHREMAAEFTSPPLG